MIERSSIGLGPGGVIRRAGAEHFGSSHQHYEMVVKALLLQKLNLKPSCTSRGPIAV
jgi:hypothetical protein